MTQEQINNIPQELRALPRWVGFMLIWNEKKGKNEKIPINPQSLWGASSTKPNTWSSFDQALSVLGSVARCHKDINKVDTVIEGHVDGIGFVLGDGISGIDLDHCVDENGQLNELAQDVAAIMDGTYLEYSVSGTGLHWLFKGDIPAKGNRKSSVEMYSSGRYFTVTGNGAGELLERTAQAAEVHKKYLASPEPTPAPPVRTAVPLTFTDDPDEVLLAKMFTSKNGPTIRTLWDGDTSAYDGDDSRADSALIMHLLYWTHGDADRTDRLFRQSSLMRDKWDERHGAQTYGELTIQKAAQTQSFSAIRDAFEPIAGNQAYGVPIAPSAAQSAEPPVQSGIIVINPLSDEQRYGWNDMGVGTLFADTYKSMARYVPQTEAWYVYDGDSWKLDSGNLRVAELAKALVRYMINAPQRLQMMISAKST